jgi:glucose-1-phosphate adenylyltransferase
VVDDALVILLAGGAGERLYPLTRDRAKPAVFFGGPYRIIDFTLSNCINSGLRRIFIATQYKSLSLNRHIRMGWTIVSEELGEFVEILPPQKRVSEHWYQGTADAVYQNLYSIVQENAQHVIVLSGDHVYKMDYAKMLRFHKERGRGRDACGDRDSRFRRRTGFGVLSVDEQDKVTGFIEKSKDAPTIPGSSDLALGSMGIYIFDTDVLLKALEADAVKPSSHDFGKDIIPRAHHRASDVRLSLLRRKQEGVEILARHRHARRVLRRQHGPVRGRSGVQFVRPRMADAHVSAPGAAGEVRVRGKKPARRGPRLDYLAGLHHLREPC